jgi:EpsI family protein
MEIGMIARRNLLLGGACLAAAAAGTALKPRREAPLLKGAKLATVVPASFGDWVSEDMGDPLAINGEGTLSAKLYNELVVRQYMNEKAQLAITALFAYGGRQSDELQLHRPEICYPAFGYDVLRNEPILLPVGGAATVPARKLLAQQDGRQESIIYWSRMGEALPQDGGQQRKARLEIAMQGIIPDGLLSRFSIVGDDPGLDWASIGAFVAELIAAIAPNRRNVLVGDARAALINASRPPVKA